jgi:hypothetical protein
MHVAHLASREANDPYDLDLERRDFLREAAVRLFPMLCTPRTAPTGVPHPDSARRAWELAEVLWAARQDHQ